VRTEQDFPYCAGIGYGQPGSCAPCMVKGYNRTLCGRHNDLYCNASSTRGQGPDGLCATAKGSVATIKGWRRIGTDEGEIAAELVSTGPLSIAIDATMDL
jgi:hypothetical protein